MANPVTIGDLTLPETESYRVVGVGATYFAPVATVGGDGKPTIVLSYRVGGSGEKIELTEDQARRLLDLGAVKPWDAPKSYDEMDDGSLKALAASRGVAVSSSGADPAQPLRTDYINALNAYDLGQDAAVIGATTVPGGVVTLGASVPVVSGEYDARGKSPAELADWIASEHPKGPEVIAAANDDPAAARALLEAESAATSGDPRSTVVRGLEKIADGGQ